MQDTHWPSGHPQASTADRHSVHPHRHKQTTTTTTTTQPRPVPGRSPRIGADWRCGGWGSCSRGKDTEWGTPNPRYRSYRHRHEVAILGLDVLQRRTWAPSPCPSPRRRTGRRNGREKVPEDAERVRPKPERKGEAQPRQTTGPSSSGGRSCRRGTPRWGTARPQGRNRGPGRSGGVPETPCGRVQPACHHHHHHHHRHRRCCCRRWHVR